MNDLEKWLAEFESNRARLITRGDTIGLKRPKIKSMLASVRLKVEMPEDSDAPQA